MAHAFSPSVQEAETIDLWILSQTDLHSKLQDSLNYIETVFKEQKHIYKKNKTKG